MSNENKYNAILDDKSATICLGATLHNNAKIAQYNDIVDAIRQVTDPEIPVNVYDLGLIYNVTQHDNGDVDIIMTLTTPSCPVAEEIPYNVANVVVALSGTGKVRVLLTWDPPWSPDCMSEEAKLTLNMF